MIEIRDEIKLWMHEYLNLNPDDETRLLDWAEATWKPLPVPGAVKYLQVVGGAQDGILRAADLLEAICFHPLRLTCFTSSSAAIVALVGLHPCVPLIDLDEFAQDRIELERFLSIGAESDRSVLQMVEKRGRMRTEAFSVYGYKVLLARRASQNPAITLRSTTIHLSPLRAIANRNDLNGYYPEIEALQAAVLRAWGDHKFFERVSDLVNTSVDDARSSANLERNESVLRVALQQAILANRKSLANLLRTELRKREKAVKK